MKKAIKPVLILLGLGLFVAILSRFPLGDILSTWQTMGWAVVLTPFIALIWFATNTSGAHCLFRGRLTWRTLFFNRLIGDGYNALLPLAGVAGEPVRVHHLAKHIHGGDAVAIVIVDRLNNIISGLLFSAILIAISMLLVDWSGLVGVALAYCAISLVITAILLVVSTSKAPGRLGHLVLVKLGSAPLGKAGLVVPLGILLRGLSWHMLGRAAAALEVGLLLFLLDLPITVTTLVTITGVLSAVGVAAFLIPQGIGVAEVASVFAFGLLGFLPVQGLAFGLVRRGRMLVISLSGVAVHLVYLRRQGQQTTE